MGRNLEVSGLLSRKHIMEACLDHWSEAPRLLTLLKVTNLSGGGFALTCPDIYMY